MKITSSQSRAGRALLNWSQDQLAEAAALSRSTIADFEREDRFPSDGNLDAIAEALGVNGVELIGADEQLGEGVRRKAIDLVLQGPHRGSDKDVRFSAAFRGERFTFSVSREPLEDIGLKGGIIETDEQAEQAARAMITRIKAVAQRKIAAGDVEKSFHLRSRDFYEVRR